MSPIHSTCEAVGDRSAVSDGTARYSTVASMASSSTAPTSTASEAHRLAGVISSFMFSLLSIFLKLNRRAGTVLVVVRSPYRTAGVMCGEVPRGARSCLPIVGPR